MASHGTDQLMVQRMLAARNLRESRLALLSSGVVIFFQFTLFLLIGVGLYVFYGPLHPQLFKTNDYIFPTFIVQQMPRGIAGLLIAAILAAAMSNLSAALNSLSSTTVVDFWLPFRRPSLEQETAIGCPIHRAFASRDEWESRTFPARRPNPQPSLPPLHRLLGPHPLRHRRLLHPRRRQGPRRRNRPLSIASVAYGCLLGVFLLGTLTSYATQMGAILGMICGFALNLYLWTFPQPLRPAIAFTWYVLIGPPSPSPSAALQRDPPQTPPSPRRRDPPAHRRHRPERVAHPSRSPSKGGLSKRSSTLFV